MEIKKLENIKKFAIKNIPVLIIAFLLTFPAKILIYDYSIIHNRFSPFKYEYSRIIRQVDGFQRIKEKEFTLGKCIILENFSKVNDSITVEISNVYDSFKRKYKALRPEQVKTIIYLRRNSYKVGSYSNGINAYAENVSVSLFDRATKKFIDSYTLESGAPSGAITSQSTAGSSKRVSKRRIKKSLYKIYKKYPFK